MQRKQLASSKLNGGSGALVHINLACTVHVQPAGPFQLCSLFGFAVLAPEFLALVV